MERTLNSIRMYQPDIQEVQDVLKDALDGVFKDVSVNVVKCPNLTLEPFNLAAPGLCGNEEIMQLGSVSNFFPSSKTWNLLDILDESRANSSFVIGGSVQCGNPHSQLIANFKYSHVDGFNDQSYRVFINDLTLSVSEPVTNGGRVKCDLFGNFFISDGMMEQVLEVSVIGHNPQSVSFLEAIQAGLRTKYGRTRPVALGGVFVVKNGGVTCFVIPREIPSSSTSHRFPLHCVSAPVIGVGSVLSFNSIVSGKDKVKGMKLIKDQNFYIFKKDGFGGGSYCNDYTSDIIYQAYFNIATRLICVDVPSLSS